MLQRQLCIYDVDDRFLWAVINQSDEEAKGETSRKFFKKYLNREDLNPNFRWMSMCGEEWESYSCNHIADQVWKWKHCKEGKEVKFCYYRIGEATLLRSEE